LGVMVPILGTGVCGGLTERVDLDFCADWMLAGPKSYLFFVHLTGFHSFQIKNLLLQNE